MNGQAIPLVKLACEDLSREISELREALSSMESKLSPVDDEGFFMSRKEAASEGSRLPARPSSEERQDFERARERWAERCRSLTEAIDRSERLTEMDLAIRINTR